MSTIILRDTPTEPLGTVGSSVNSPAGPLTNLELDDNFHNLNLTKLESDGSIPCTGTQKFDQITLTNLSGTLGLEGPTATLTLGAVGNEIIIPGILTANATSADILSTPRDITITGDASGSAPFDGSGDISIPVSITSVTSALTLTNPRTISLSGDASGSVAFDGSSNVSIATTVNNASTANQLATSRNIIIGGDASGTAAFDGTADANITLAVNTLATARDFSITGGVSASAVSFDGSGNVVLNATVSDISGLTADAATVLETSRDISLTGDITGAGVAFNGSANIGLSGKLSPVSETISTTTATASETVVYCDVVGAGGSIALEVTTTANAFHMVKNLGGYDVIITPDAGLIEGESSLTLTSTLVSDKPAVTIHCDGTNWYIL